MKKETIIGIVVGVLIILGGYFYLDNQERLMDEETRVGEPVKMDLPKTETQKVEDEKYTEELAKFSLEHNKTRTQKKSSKKFKTLEDGTKHEIIPYTEELPPMPDEEENNSTLFGVDSNNNGVRDDLEILTVQLFGEDRDVVEAEFALIRSNSRADVVAKKAIDLQAKISDEDIKDIQYNIYIYIGCIGHYGDYMEVLDEDNIINKQQYNTSERKELDRKIISNMRGGGGEVIKFTDKVCKKYIEKTKHYEYFN